ncbi:redoxin domain-containing protein [Pedobacter psychrodurus]|uniref:Redoxin domain-containing protein n=1 Tax=Pedobacter psychrodurus TaxID=2530456 RepID=A0A4R0PWZ7_9SPHI|nr:redoxin domain-containing protein [Pedobacter psychrodurus]TCD27304.1 redoxin domain-containing protein [Pedobacter psychrodurus]
MKRSPIKKVIILVSILAIPGFLFFYLLPQFAKNRYKRLPIFGDKVVASTFHSVKGKKIPDTIYHLVPDFKLLNQHNDTVTWKSLKNKIVVLNMFYTSANNQGASKYIKKLSEGYEQKPLVKFLSLSVDPLDGSKIKDFAEQFKAKVGKWDFLVGDTIQTYPLIRKGLLLDVVADEKNEKTNFIFSNKIVLIDNLHRIRGIYEADNAEANARLEDEIKVLIAEYLRNVKDGR